MSAIRIPRGRLNLFMKGARETMLAAAAGTAAASFDGLSEA